MKVLHKVQHPNALELPFLFFLPDTSFFFFFVLIEMASIAACPPFVHHPHDTVFRL